MAEGTTFKRCYCRDSSGKDLGRDCPKLRRPNGAWSNRHGTWFYQMELPPKADGKRRNPLRRGGFATQDEAEGVMNQARELLAIAAEDDLRTRIKIADAITAHLKDTGQLPDPGRVRKMVRAGQDPATRPPTVGEWLDQQWLPGKKKLRKGTVRSYAAHVRLYYVPNIGDISVDRLRVTDVASVFEAIDEQNDLITEARASDDAAVRASVRNLRIISAETKQRIRATLRSALTTYMKQQPGVLTFNAAALVELPSGTRPKPLVWTEERTREWQQDFQDRLAEARLQACGRRVDPVAVWVSVPRPSPVMVWTLAQVKVFLTHARKHRLYAMYHLVAFRGLRRGEACGLRRTDTDLPGAVTNVRWQITQLGWGTEEGAPKSEAGERQVALDQQTVKVLRAHRRRQDTERDTSGDAWTASGFEFTTPDGAPLHPASVTDMFELIAYGCGLPPIRLHDLRHFAATLALAAGVDIKVVQEQIGHSSRAITSDTYTTVLPEVARAAAEATAALLPMDTTGTREPARSPQPGKSDTRKKKDLGETPGQYGCAARDLNPEPAD